MSFTLLEAKTKPYMTTTELLLKKRLIKLLQDDGQGHRHAKFAERLKPFDINIVSLSVDPNFTAAISFDTATIYISQGFLQDENTFFQLNVLMRHELSHNLLMHQIRMLYKFKQSVGEEAARRLSYSSSLHTLLNYLEDFEISNTRYTDADKIIVRNMVLNGEVISGLITEDHRKDWLTLSLEDMYDRVCEEIKVIHKKILANRTSDINAKDAITTIIAGTLAYTDKDSSSVFQPDLKTFIDRGCKLEVSQGQFKKIGKDFEDIVKAIYDKKKSNYFDDKKVENIMNKIVKSNPVEIIKLFTGKLILYTPEDKFIAMNALKKCFSKKTEWYRKVRKACISNKLTATQVQEILDAV